LRLEVGERFTAGAVIAELGGRYGSTFRERVLLPDGRLNGCCRICVDGQMVDDLAAPIRAQTSGTEMEFILLWATEGG
jgi:hypothetical protein